MSDRVPFAVAQHMFRAETPEPMIRTSGVNSVSEQEYLNTLDYAVRSLHRSNVPQADIDADPGTLELMGAAFRMGNSLVSAWSSEDAALNRRGDQSETLTRQQVIDRLRADGLTSMMHLFGSVDTADRYEAIKSDLAREQRDNRTLAAATGIRGPMALLAAGVLDFPTVLPAGAVLPAARGANLARTVRNVAASAGVDAALTEAVLQNSQVLHTWQESAINIGASVFLGGLLGAGVHAAFGPAVARTIETRTQAHIDDAQRGYAETRAEGDKVVRAILTTIDEESLADTARQTGKTVDEVRAEVMAALTPEQRSTIASLGPDQARRSVGAAGVSNEEILAASLKTKSDRVGSMYAYESLQALGKAPGFVGDNLRMPRLELENGATSLERDFVQRFTFNPSINVHQVPGMRSAQGTAAPRSVSADISRFQGEFAQAIHEVETLWRSNKVGYRSLDDFAERVTLALVNLDQAADPVVQQAAQIFRKRVLEPIRKQLVENGNFREGMELDNALSYFPLVLDADAIRANKEAFISLRKAGFLNQLEEEFRVAQVEKTKRASERQDAKHEAKEGKEKTTAEVRAEHEENIRALRETREQEVARFEQDSVDMREKLRAERDTQLDEIKETRDEMLGGDIDANETRVISSEARDASAAQSRAEHQQNIQDIHRSRTEALATHDTEAKAMREKVAADRDERLAELRETRDEMLGGDVEAKEATRIRVSYTKDVAAARKQSADELRKLNSNLKRERAAIEKRFNDQVEASQKARDKALKEAADEADKQVKEARNERERIEKSHDTEAKRINQTYQRELRQLEVRLARERKDLTKKFDDLEAEARDARDAAVKEAQERADALRGAAQELGLSEGLSVLRFATREAREAEAAARAERYYQGAVGNTRFTLAHEVIDNGDLRGYFKTRSSPTWHAQDIEQGFAKTNVFDIMDHYVRTAGTDAAIGMHYKKPGPRLKGADPDAPAPEPIGDPKLSDLLSTVKEEYNSLIAIAKDPKQELELVNKRDRALANIALLRDFARGVSASDGASSLHKTAEWVGTFNYVRLFGGTVFSSLGDPVNIAVANSFGRTMQYGIVPMLTDFNTAYRAANGDLRRLARLTMANAEMELNSRIAQLAELGNPHSKVDTGTNMLRNTAKIFSRWTGITYWNSFWKQVGYNTAQARIIEHATDGWSKLDVAQKTWLNNLGIDQKGLERIGAAYASQTAEKTAAGIPIARFDTWADADARNLIQAALSNESHNLVVTPHFSDKMALNNNPAKGLIMQGRRFMLSNQMRVIGRNLQLASVDDEGSKRLGVYAGLFALTFMGAMVDGTKQIMGGTTVTGGNVDPNRNAGQRVVDAWQKTPGTALYNALDRSSIFGIAFETSNILERMGLPNVRAGVSRLAQDDRDGQREAARFANRGVFESLLGPTAGAVEDFGKLGSFGTGSLGYLFGINDDPHFNRSDFRRGRRFIPFQNAPGVQQILNYGEAEVGSIFDWPAPR